MDNEWAAEEETVRLKAKAKAEAATALHWLRANPNPIYAGHNCSRRKRRISRGRAQLVGCSAASHIRQIEQKRSDKFWRAEIWVTKRKLRNGRTNEPLAAFLSHPPLSLSLSGLSSGSSVPVFKLVLNFI